MRILFLILFSAIASIAMGQKVDSIIIPKGVAYKYCDQGIVVTAKTLLLKELSDSSTYSLNKGIVFIGPSLWTRYKKIPALEAIREGNVTIRFNKENLAAKVTQNEEDFKKIWDQVRSEVNQKDIKLRKASPKELEYYWAVISFDIEEPLLIAETNEHRYILNLSPKDLTLVWLDEVPPTVK